MNFLAELRKRNVFRAMAAYLVGAWIMVQVAGFVADAAEMPPWTDSMILILVLMGLPIVFVASWALELTPDGIKKSGSETELEPRPVGPVDYILIAAVVVVLGLFGWQMFSRPAASPEPLVAEATGQPEEDAATVVTGQSIAIMPFVAISEAPEDVVLGDGLAEELLNVLAQFPDLMVAGRTSSFSFRDQVEDIPAIGAALGVNHVLEGSVRRAGEQVRVTAQLIRAADGFHVWSGTYDRPFEDILSVQDDIVRQIAQVLTIRLGVATIAQQETRTANSSAYEQYLRGRVMWAERHVIENRSAAMDAFQTAVDIDPDFADGWAALARSIMYSNPPEGYTIEEHRERGYRAAVRALELDPDNPEAMVALSGWHYTVSRNWNEAVDLVERAIELAPNAAYTHYGAVLVHEYTGDVERMTRAIRRAVALDPLNLTIRENGFDRYVRAERFGDAQRLLNTGAFDVNSRIRLTSDIAFAQRDPDAAEEAYEAFKEIADEVFPGFSELEEHVDNVVAAYAAAYRGEADVVRALMPAVEAAITANASQANDIASLYYVIGEYETAAAKFLEIYNADGPQIDDNIIFAHNRFVEPGMLCQPDYHAIWALPEWASLAEIRRANGATGNLPLSGPECARFLEAAE